MKKINKWGFSLPADLMGWLILGLVILVVIIGATLVLKGKISGGIGEFNILRRFGKG